MDYILSQRLVNSCGNAQKTAGLSGRTGRVIMTKEARVLRELRIQAGLSMRKAGALIGCTDSYISHIENGRTAVPKGDRLDKFLAVYGGIKQKSFYERVRRYQDQEDPRQKLIKLASEASPALLIQIMETLGL
jgi:transcriptional regulator with XRE-family HTH domain